MNGIRKPNKGSISIDGDLISYNRNGLKKLRQQVGIVFQNPDNQLFSADVFQEISFGPMNLGWDKEKVREEVNNVMDSLQIQYLAKRPTHFLSGGQKKQVAIADVLAMEPSVILFDEPTAALDGFHSKLVNDLIDELCDRGITVVQATHDSDYAMAWADKIVVMKEGRILIKDKPQVVFEDKDVCENACLAIPHVLMIYKCLCRNHKIEKVEDGTCPRTIEKLMDMIDS